MVVVPELGQWQFDMRMIYQEIPDIMMFRDISGKSVNYCGIAITTLQILEGKIPYKAITRGRGRGSPDSKSTAALTTFHKNHSNLQPQY